MSLGSECKNYRENSDKYKKCIKLQILSNKLFQEFKQENQEMLEKFLNLMHNKSNKEVMAIFQARITLTNNTIYKQKEFKMSQHFLLSAKSKTISELEVARMSEDEARETFEKLRWSDTDGKPVCNNCGCTDSYTLNVIKNGKTTRRYKCSACRKQYTVTSGTIFASHKLELRDYLLATIIFVNAVKGISAFQMSRALGCQYKTAFVLIHKLRASLMDNNSLEDIKLSGVVEMDGCYIGKTKPANRKIDRVDLRLAQNSNPNKRCIMVARQRADEDSNFIGATATKTFITKSENSYAINKIATTHITKNTTVHVDGAKGYDDLDAWFDVKVGDHSQAYIGEDGECSNQQGHRGHEIYYFFVSLWCCRVGALT